MKRILWTLLSFAAIFILLTQCGSDEEIVARIGNERITVDEFRGELRERFQNKAIRDISFEQKRNILDELLDERRKVLKAKELGLDENPQYLREMNDQKRTALAIALYNKIVIDQLLSEEVLQNYYNWSSYNVKAVIIRIGYKEAEIFAKDRTKEEAKAKAEEHKEKLRTAKEPEKYALQVTDDTRNRPLQSPYRLGLFTYAVDKAIFNHQPGEVFGPIDTPKGFVVAKILEREKKEQSSDFESAKKTLKRRLRSSFSSQQKEMFENYSDKFQEKYDLQIDQDGINQFYTVFQKWVENSEHKLSDFTEQDRNIQLGMINGESYTTGDFIDRYGKYLVKSYQRFRRKDQFVDGFVKNEVEKELNKIAWAIEGEKQGLEESKKVREQVRRFKTNRLTRLLEEHEVKDKIQVSDDEIQAYYDSHQEEYLEPERIQIWQIAVKNESEARNIIRQAKSGRDFEKVSTEFNNQARLFTLGYQTGRYPKKKIVDAAFEAGSNQIVGPIALDSLYYVLKTGKYQAQQVKPVHEVKSSIYSKLFNQKQGQRQEEFLKEIRKEYTFRINESILRGIS